MDCVRCLGCRPVQTILLLVHTTHKVHAHGVKHDTSQPVRVSLQLPQQLASLRPQRSCAICTPSAKGDSAAACFVLLLLLEVYRQPGVWVPCNAGQSLRGSPVEEGTASEARGEVSAQHLERTPD